MTTQKTTTAPQRLKVGDQVRFRWGDSEIEGQVVEDRGKLGADGEQIVRVRAEFDMDFVRDAEMFASRLTLVRTAS